LHLCTFYRFIHIPAGILSLAGLKNKYHAGMLSVLRLNAWMRKYVMPFPSTSITLLGNPVLPIGRSIKSLGKPVYTMVRNIKSIENPAPSTDSSMKSTGKQVFTMVISAKAVENHILTLARIVKSVNNLVLSKDSTIKI
jgi:hypothetical protein